MVNTNVGFVTDDGVQRRRSEEEQQVIVWKSMLSSAILKDKIRFIVVNSIYIIL